MSTTLKIPGSSERGTLTNAFVHEPRKPFTPQQRARIFQAHGGRCHRCTRKIRPGETWSVEHLTALECGGGNEDANLAISCAWCKPQKDRDDHAKAAKGRRVATKHVVPAGQPQRRQGFRGWRKFNGDLVVLK